MISKHFSRLFFRASKPYKFPTQSIPTNRVCVYAFRRFAARTDFWEDSKMEVINKLNKLVNEEGQTLQSKGILKDVEVKEGGEVTIHIGEYFNIFLFKCQIVLLY